MKWGFLRPDGRLLFDPLPFENLYDFNAGYAIVKRGGKWGIIDENGRFTVEPQFDSIRFTGTLQSPVFDVNQSGREYTISPTGRELPATAKPDPRPAYLTCKSGARLVSRADSRGSRTVWGLVDEDGREVIKPQFRALQCFQNGVAWAAIDAKRQWCPVDPDGTVRTQPACVTSRYPYLRTESYPEFFACDPYESSVLWTLAYLEYGSGRRSSPPRVLSVFGDRSSTTQRCR